MVVVWPCSRLVVLRCVALSQVVVVVFFVGIVVLGVGGLAGRGIRAGARAAPCCGVFGAWAAVTGCGFVAGTAVAVGPVSVCVFVCPPIVGGGGFGFFGRRRWYPWALCGSRLLGLLEWVWWRRPVV